MHFLLAAAAWAALSLIPVSETELPKIIDKHSGKAVVLNFWATWCSPCREEFPYLVRLQETWGRDKLAVVTVSMDEPEQEAAALEFLQEQGANFPGYIRGFEDFEAFVNAIDPDWSGALPATFIFNKDGDRVFSIVGKLSEVELREQVSTLID